MKRVIFLLTIATVALSTRQVLADRDTCKKEITRVERLFHQAKANPRSPLSGTQSISAQLHHQPTPDSIKMAKKTAEKKLEAILTRAKRLDTTGHQVDCLQAVQELKHLLSDR